MRSHMSTEEHKIKHSERIHQKETHMKKQASIARAHGMNVRPGDEHKFAKQHAMDCGQPGCLMCGNPRKTFKELTVQEKSFEQTKQWDQE